MLYIVGGAARSGKTSLARRMLAIKGVPWFSLDILRVGLTKGVPALGLDFDHEDLDEAGRLWPVISEMIGSILFFDADYLVEGSCLRPRDVAALMAARADNAIRALFLGFPHISARAKLGQMAANGGGGNDWFSPLPKTQKKTQVARMIRDSRQLRGEARAANIPFLDTGEDFLARQAEAIDILTRPA